MTDGRVKFPPPEGGSVLIVEDTPLLLCGWEAAIGQAGQDTVVTRASKNRDKFPGTPIEKRFNAALMRFGSFRNGDLARARRWAFRLELRAAHPLHVMSICAAFPRLDKHLGMRRFSVVATQDGMIEQPTQDGMIEVRPHAIEVARNDRGQQVRLVRSIVFGVSTDWMAFVIPG